MTKRAELEAELDIRWEALLDASKMLIGAHAVNDWGRVTPPEIAAKLVGSARKRIEFKTGGGSHDPAL